MPATRIDPIAEALRVHKEAGRPSQWSDPHVFPVIVEMLERRANGEPDAVRLTKQGIHLYLHRRFRGNLRGNGSRTSFYHFLETGPIQDLYRKAFPELDRGP